VKTVCRGNWAGNAHALLVFRDDGQGGADNDTICQPCLEAMRDKLKEVPACSPVTTAP
jgi:hypothetical protein